MTPEAVYAIEACLVLLILCVCILCWQVSNLLDTLDKVYQREEILHRIRTGHMIDFNRKIKPTRRKRY
nr:MAG TPA: hypothetical protein [Caudoviricetes sp.]